ncbi:MAG: energy transducer TonB [Polynucleobacter sp.]|uniref:energy transducer TonB n=1 Tax=Polynucleobacter sp. TaxID=2029855 RepID=UPI00271C49D2|nr:energy transducer TonB [Polynucleobacter sp.]MDO9013410.1 energy transducer TonB [Polynucleobacter sp.]MDP3121401.1 energy transducer TonB [Polynucleobacter sp.]
MPLTSPNPKTLPLFTRQEWIVIAVVLALHGMFFVSLDLGLNVKNDPSENEVRVMANLVAPATPPAPPVSTPPTPQPKPEVKPKTQTKAEPKPKTPEPSSTPPADASQAKAAEAAKAAETQMPNAAVAPATSQGAAGTPIQTDIGKLVVVYQPDADPYYPSFSKRAGEQGEVVVRLIIDETGIVEEVALLRSSGFPRLDRAASEIGKRYRFKPYSVNGNPARISTNLLIKFNLKN